MSFPNPDEARHRLDELVSSVPNTSATSTTKFDHITDWFRVGLGLEDDDVYTVWVSKAGNLKVRLEQRGKPTRVGIALLKSAEELTKSLRAGRKLVGTGRPCEDALVFCTRPAVAKWTVAAVIRPESVPTTIALEEAFPDADVSEPILPPGESVAPTAGSLDQLADELFVDRGWLRDVVWLLRDKKGLVLYGPPGTGKTYIMLKLAEHLQPDSNLRRLVQLHPSYGYEDFFEGFRPSATVGGGFQLTLEEGPLRGLCEMAHRRPEDDAFIILDEMNRGNLPKVFGELYFALEYRDRPVRLMYSKQDFTLPDRLSFMGTMNTADRSIALLDQALRRRFHFVGLFPGEVVVDGMFERYLAKHHPSMEWLADVLAAANDLLGDRNVAVGPSHFMRPDLDEKIVARIWRHSVLPTIEEHFFGDEARLAEFQLEALREAVAPASEDVDDA